MSATGLVLLTMALGACDPWSFSNPEDPYRCDPGCLPDHRCHEGSCVPRAVDGGAPSITDGGRSLWARRYGGQAKELANDVARSPTTDDVAVVGNFYSNSKGGGERSDAFAIYYRIAELEQTPSWHPIFGGTHSDTAASVAFGPDGTVHVAGMFNLLADFDGLQVQSSGYDDAYFVSLDGKTGKRKSFKGFGSTGWDACRELAVRPNGNLVVAGTFSSSEFDVGGNPFYKRGGNAQSTDFYLAEYSATGAHLWSRAYGGKGSDNVLDLAVTREGDLVVAGAFEDRITFGQTVLVSKGYSDAFVLKTDSAGLPLWARSFGSSNGESAVALAVDGPGNIYVAGNTTGSVIVGGQKLPFRGQTDGLLVSYAAAGTLRWSLTFGDTSHDEAKTVAITPSGDLLYGGSFSNAVSIAGYRLTSKAKRDGFVARLSNMGKLRWIRQFGGPGDDVIAAVVSTSKNEVYAAGTFEQTLAAGAITLKSQGETDVMLIKMSP